MAADSIGSPRADPSVEVGTTVRNGAERRGATRPRPRERGVPKLSLDSQAGERQTGDEESGAKGGALGQVVVKTSTGSELLSKEGCGGGRAKYALRRQTLLVTQPGA